MKFIRPTLIADAMLISSSVLENDYPAWIGATLYAEGARVIRATATIHKIYERRVSGATATAPELDADNWIEVSPTNRWKMFDKAVGTETVAAAPLAVTVAPGVVRALALLDIAASSVRVVMTDGATGPTVYDREFVMADTAETVDWYGYFFGELRRQSDLLVTDLPPYGSGRLTVTLEASGDARCGTMVVGALVEIGQTQHGAGIGIVDYSRKDVDEYGVATILERGYAKRTDVSVWCENARIDYIVKQLAAVRATPCVWVANARYGSLIVYGFYRDWDIDIPYHNNSIARLTIEGLT